MSLNVRETIKGPYGLRKVHVHAITSVIFIPGIMSTLLETRKPAI